MNATNKCRGGIRGIVELEVLRALETALGGLSIQAFFDLIVGTRCVLPSVSNHMHQGRGPKVKAKQSKPVGQCDYGLL